MDSPAGAGSTPAAGAGRGAPRLRCPYCRKTFLFPTPEALLRHELTHAGDTADTGDRAVVADAKLPPTQRKRKRPLAEPGGSGSEPETKRGGKAPANAAHIKAEPPSTSTAPPPGRGRATSRVSKVTQPEQAHTVDRPFTCAYCPKRFSKKCHVAPHTRTHTGEKPYGCSMCPQRFTQKSNVAPHERRRHKREQPHLSEVVMAPSLAALVAAAEATLGAMI